MKVKIAAGAELDLLNRDELKHELVSAGAAWRSAVALGDRFRPFRASALPAGGTVSIGGSATEDKLGPSAGYVWDIKMLMISGINYAGAEIVGVYRNEATPLALITTTDCSENNRGLFIFNGGNIVLYPGDELLVYGTTAVAVNVVVTGMAREVPISLAWRL